MPSQPRTYAHRRAYLNQYGRTRYKNDPVFQAKAKLRYYRRKHHANEEFGCIMKEHEGDPVKQFECIRERFRNVKASNQQLI